MAVNYDHLKKQVKQIDIVKVVERYSIILKKDRSSRRYVGFCPFHPDKRRPNLTVNSEEDNFHYYRCNEGGDSITFVMKKENKDFKEALLDMANKFNIPIPKNNKDVFKYDPEATFDYHNENGQLIYQIVRSPGKQFKQRRPDSNGG